MNFRKDYPSVNKIIAHYKKLGFKVTMNADKDWLKIYDPTADADYVITLMATKKYGIDTMLVCATKTLTDTTLRAKVDLTIYDVAPDVNPKAIITAIADFNLVNNALKGH